MQSDLRTGTCQACEGGVQRLTEAELQEVLQDLPAWQAENDSLCRTLNFRNYYETMAFVNAVAWVAAREDHHPDLEVSYNRCIIRWQTHGVGGITRNDVICAQAVDALLA